MKLAQAEAARSDRSRATGRRRTRGRVGQEQQLRAIGPAPRRGAAVETRVATSAPSAVSSRAGREAPADSRSPDAQTRWAKTFDVPEVEDDFISFCQLTSHAAWSPAEAENQRLILLRQVANHVCLPEFASAVATREICGPTLLQPLQSGIEVDQWIDTRSIYARLCATRLLTVREECEVMRRMHYFKYLAWQILSSGSVNEWDLVRAHGLVKAAMWHRDLMVQANMRLIVSIVKKLPIDSHWFDELISDGAVALLRAVDKFDPSRGYRFCTYATTVIRRECYLHIKERRLDQGKFKKTAVLPVLSVVRSKLPADPDASVEVDRAHWLAWRDRLAGMMGVLTRREQVIIRSRYCLGSHRKVKTLQRLSVALKISKERVRQLELGALAKLRAAAEMEMEMEM